ncbi:hypothetical protein E4U40_007846 [Claviceps sp. LM458 group G5]|nr:hypothetical protein E4U40_007846 [Claviceps sp. LM458 group G5]
MMGFLALGASVSARAISEPIYHRVVPTWRVTIEPGEDLENMVLVNGTIQQVDAYMDAHYPGWSAKHANTTYWVHPKESPASMPDLMKVKSVTCNYPLHRASTRAILGGIDQLRSISLDRTPSWVPSPGTCGKLSCSEEGAIFWCNDSEALKFKTLEGFSDIAAAAQAILYQCAISGDTLMPMVSGKTTLFGDYTFIVGKSSCGADF